METDETTCQDHRRHVEQFIGKRPPEGTQEQLEHIGYQGDGVGESHSLSCEHRRLEFLKEYVKHSINQYTGSRRNNVEDVTPALNPRNSPRHQVPGVLQ